MDPFKYREVQALFTARLPDSADSDQLPDRVPLNGYGTLRPNIRGTSVVFTEVGEFAVPRTRQVAFVDGELMVEVVDGESSILQPLFLEVTVDERANQQWSWTLTFDSLTIGEWGEEISHPALSFPVEDGDGPLELSTVATTVTRTANFVTRGAPGPGITGITASNGIVTVEWDGGDNIAIPIPTATLATPTNDGLMPRRTMAAVDNLRAGEDDQWRVMDTRGSVALSVTESGGVRAGGAESRASDAPFRLLDSNNRIAFEVDHQGRTHIHDLAGGGGPTVTEWHVFVAAGQSNMSGSGQPYSTELDPPHPRIHEYGSTNRTIRPAGVPLDMNDSFVRGMSPATGFAREYLRHVPGHVGVLLVPAAKSGTAFTDDPDTPTWRPGAASSPEWDLYQQSVTQTLEALDAIGAEGQLKGILWHQGEGNGYMETAEYAADLDNLITHYRADLSDPDLPFMVGQMSQERIASHPARWRVDRAHSETPARVVRTGFAPSDWGWVSYDETHFGRTGALLLGARFVDAYWQALANTEGSQVLPPVEVTARRVGDEVSVTWGSPPTRITGYQIRMSVAGSESWSDVPREWPMSLSETFSTADPVDIEVFSVQGSSVSTVVRTSA